MNQRYTRIRYTQSESSPAGRRDPFGSLRSRAAGPIGRALALVAGGLILVAALFVSAVVFSVLLVAGAVAGGWFWWKTRGLRREIRERLAQMKQMQEGEPGREQAGGPAGFAPGAGTARTQSSRAGGDIIDGDFIRETDPVRETEPPHR